MSDVVAPTAEEIQQLEEFLDMMKEKAEASCEGMIQVREEDYTTRVVGMAKVLDSLISADLHSFFAAVAIDKWAQERYARG